MKTRALSEAERIDWLRLAQAESVGPVSFAHLMDRYGSPSRALTALPDLARRGGRAADLHIPGRAEAEQELEAAAAAGARMIACCEAAFPRLLAAVDPPPPFLWALGEPAFLQRPTVALVGARIASASGCRFARTLAGALGEAGYVVVSGMARGIDAAAHEGALPHGTAAVLAGGVDNIFPPEHGGLHRALVERGCIVSERAMGHQARAADFPRRNRIISGLSLGVVVVEAELRSGSLITARLAGEQGREVFAVPGSPLDPRARGCNALLRQGAILVEDADDILRVLASPPAIASAPRRAYPLADEDLGDDGEAEGAAAELVSAVRRLLSITPTPVDELARAAAAPTASVLAALMELSLAGRARLLPGGLAARV